MNTTFCKAVLLVIITCCPSIVWADCVNTGTNTNSTAQPVTYSTDIYLSELLPNPSTDEASDEFIELYNAGSTAVDLTGWSLSDATDKTYTLSSTIAAGSYLAIYRSDSGIALNNTGDTAELYNPNTVVQDSIEYTDSADDDISYALTKTGDWTWTTTPTPHIANVIKAVAVTSITTTTQPTTQSDTQTDPATTSTQYDLSNKIQLSELLPDPAGSDATDEWIELYNGDSKAINLTGWEIVDSSHAFTIQDITIQPSGYAVFAVVDTHISLNNSGEAIQLVDPAGTEIDSQAYPTAIPGQSYARTGSVWTWTTTLTPNANNIITLSATDTEPTHTDTTTDNTNPTSAGLLTIAMVKQQESNAKVVVEGTVSVLPGIFSTSYFYIQDATSGVQIYASSKAFPTLAVGDTVQVTGTIGTSNGEIKINTSNADDIVIVSHGTTITPLPVVSYVVDNAGQVVQITGTVSGKSGSTVTLDSGWTVYVKRGTGVSTTSFVVGASITIAGVLIATTDEVQVWPRSVDDLTSSTGLASGTTSTTTTDTTAHITTQHALSDETFSLSNILPATTQAIASLGVLGWLCIAAGLALGITLLFRSDRLKNLVRNWISAKVHGWEERSDHSVGLEKNTTDLNAPTQYHELRLFDKTPS